MALPLPCSGQFLNAGDILGIVMPEETRVIEILVPEHDADKIDRASVVKARAWAYPTDVFLGSIEVIDRVVYDKVKRRLERSLTEREVRMSPVPVREEEPVVRVVCRLRDEAMVLKPGMTGYAKIAVARKPLVLAFSQWLVRFVMVEVWSWIP